MTAYLNYEFKDSEDFISTWDELPLWSAPFGLLLLKHVELKPNLRVLDIGAGTGFPVAELAQRLGSTCHCVALDPWVHANNRLRKKIINYEINNLEVVEGKAEQIPFPDNHFDLIVSNLGINNVDDVPLAFSECNRVLKPNGRFVITTNLNGHWKEFYKVFEDTLLQMNKSELLGAVKHHEEHRGSAASISNLLTSGGFSIHKTIEEGFDMRFLNGSSFLNHYFIKLGFLSSWKNIIPVSEQQAFFTQHETNLNAYAEEHAELKLTVPMLYIEGVK